jgi:hypothetical protein
VATPHSVPGHGGPRWRSVAGLRQRRRLGRGRFVLPSFVRSESLDSDNRVMPGVCFAGQPRVSVEPASVRPDYRSHRRSVTAEMAFRPQLWKSSQAEACSRSGRACAIAGRAALSARSWTRLPGLLTSESGGRLFRIRPTEQVAASRRLRTSWLVVHCECDPRL